MEQVSCRVIFNDPMAAFCINFKCVCFTNYKRRENVNHMKVLAIWCMLNILNFCNDFTCSIFNHTVVRHLSTHFRVEWCFIKDKLCFTAYSIHFFIIFNCHKKLAIIFFNIVEEFRFFFDGLKRFVLCAH